MTTSFPKMGEEPLTSNIVNISGDRSPYTQSKAKFASGDALATGGTAVRGVGPDATGEHSGPAFAPQTTICFPNSPEASDTGRGMRTVRSSLGNRDFWDSRSGQTGSVIDGSA